MVGFINDLLVVMMEFTAKPPGLVNARHEAELLTEELHKRASPSRPGLVQGLSCRVSVPEIHLEQPQDVIFVPTSPFTYPDHLHSFYCCSVILIGPSLVVVLL